MKRRLDVRVVEEGLAPSRERAQALILAGKVLVNDVPATKPGQNVEDAAVLRVKGDDLRYVSRGGLKLERALDVFRVEVAGRVAFDIGASTGGFTDVLLQRGVAKVVAIDVGHNQMDWKIRQDPRVVVMEKTNARYLTLDQIAERPGVIVMDVSFISIDKILPALVPFASRDTDWITLVKPQFEVGKDRVGKGGIVSSEEDHRAVNERLRVFGESLGLVRQGLIDSPITGTQGNKEFLAHWRLASG